MMSPPLRKSWEVVGILIQATGYVDNVLGMILAFKNTSKVMWPLNAVLMQAT
jgi:hypothetical protein